MLKGRTTIGELMDLPNQIIQYYYRENFIDRIYKDIKERENKENKNGEGDNVIDPNVDIEELEEILEDAGL